jgi:hypothetical protein
MQRLYREGGPWSPLLPSRGLGKRITMSFESAIATYLGQRLHDYLGREVDRAGREVAGEVLVADRAVDASDINGAGLAAPIGHKQGERRAMHCGGVIYPIRRRTLLFSTSMQNNLSARGICEVMSTTFLGPCRKNFSRARCYLSPVIFII